ncbi:siderophore biosynthesis acetylase [Moniliophthora roreri MCA 2997]|uniref:Siderophore biosynthesis acetylase n=1 Tax=Moniliophthora roreri (strain MCA 2997) TaxID=1381753 RepID=V2X7K9_MONRO|nr:siderophore biosynthesis acetylase [Moniliophthora roreri MCA 2997]
MTSSISNTSPRTTGYVREEYVAPADLTFTLPDGVTTVRSVKSEDGSIQVFLPSESKTVSFVPSDRKLRTSPHSIVNADRAVHTPAFQLTTSQNLTTPDVWVALYAFWIRHSSIQVHPLILPSPEDSATNSAEILTYLTHTGLAFTPPDAEQVSQDLILVRASFWQGAGAPLNFHWIQTPVPHPSISPLNPFAFTQSFTRSEHVLTTHPLRPPKPAPGSVVYSRYIFQLGELLTLTHIDANNPAHFETYCRWQNSDRVNVGWRERGPEEHHRKYLADRLKDPHIMGVIVSWNGEMAGYGEMSWVKEDPMGTYVGGLGDYDQGTHLLIGEEKFRGRQRFTAVMTSLKHACFLRDPRTEVVVGEPRADLPIIPRLIAYLPQELNREFEFPHKRAVYFTLRRERFFQAAMLD